mgnify:CR=1 FL=1
MSKYVCPDCGANLVIVRYTKTHYAYPVDPDTGEFNPRLEPEYETYYDDSVQLECKKDHIVHRFEVDMDGGHIVEDRE